MAGSQYKLRPKSILAWRLPNPGYLKLKKIEGLKDLKFRADLNIIVGGLFVFFCFFPYNKTIQIIDSGIQPNALLMAMFLTIVWIPYKIPKGLIFFFFILVVATLVLLLGPKNVLNLRNYLGYFSLAVITYATFCYLRKNGKYPHQFMTIAVGIWTFFGVVQTLYTKTFGAFLLAKVKSTEGRGVFSLSAEPTFYGIISVVIGLIIIVSDHPKKNYLLAALVFGIVFLAQSAMTILFLILLLGFYFLIFVSPKIVFYSILILSLLVGAFFLNINNPQLTDARFVRMIRQLNNNGIEWVFKYDQSVNERAGHIYFSFKGFFDAKGTPNGFASFKDYLNEEVPKQDIFIHLSDDGKIMSTYGAAVYELGVFGLLVPLGISVLIFMAYPGEIRRPLLMFVFVNMILFTSIPISYPPIGFLMGSLIYRRYKILNNLSTETNRIT